MHSSSPAAKFNGGYPSLFNSSQHSLLYASLCSSRNLLDGSSSTARSSKVSTISASSGAFQKTTQFSRPNSTPSWPPSSPRNPKLPSSIKSFSKTASHRHSDECVSASSSKP